MRWWIYRQLDRGPCLGCFCVFVAFFLVVIPASQSLHLTGRFETGSTFFKFLGKFGFQQTGVHDKPETQGYIYGNVSLVGSASNLPIDADRQVTFALLDSEYFAEYFSSRSINRTLSCERMFRKIDTIAWDEKCNQYGQEDFLRGVPCEANKLCYEEDNPESVIEGYQFTYRVQDINQARFWYVSMVSCSRNRTNASACHWWHDATQRLTLDYDIWLVNGSPSKRHLNPFEHQFSFELHDVFELYLAFFVLYTFLLPVQFYALSVQRHLLPFLLTVSMCLEYTGVIFNFIHVAKFAADGEGVMFLKVTGSFLDMSAQCLFMLLLLLIVKGWTITRMQLSCLTKVVLFTVWVAYTSASIALFVWNQVEVDRISDVDEWQTWPGWIILGFRLVIMLFFLWELRGTFLLEHSMEKAQFYLHFGAGFLVWFVYLPLVNVICMQVSALWRYKTILSVMHAADFLSLCVMVHLLWPTRSYLYFNLKQLESRVQMDGMDGLSGATLLDSAEESGEETILDLTRLSTTPPKQFTAVEQQNSNKNRLKNNHRNGRSKL